jgi:hypothetical protein
VEVRYAPSGFTQIETCQFERALGKNWLFFVDRLTKRTDFASYWATMKAVTLLISLATF